MNISEQRRAIRPLLDEQKPADAMASFFAYYHPLKKTTIQTFPAGAIPAAGYVCLSQTGIDLFRPFLTMRLPIKDVQASAETLFQALQPGVPVILSAPEEYRPLLTALFEVEFEERLKLFKLRATQFEPLINVLMSEDKGANGLPRFVIRDRQRGNLLIAAAGINWQTRHFAEISVTTHPQYRRQGYGRSVVAAMANTILQIGRTPLYAVSDQNVASSQLAQQVGFVDTLSRNLMIHGSLKPD